MVDEPNSPVVFRAVKHAAAEKTKEPPQTGIAFECPTQTKCQHCKAVVPLAGTKPLSEIPCPACGGGVFVLARVHHFLIYAHIGDGEMGAIYRAADESLYRDVAIKLVRGCLADDRESRERLRREACAAGRLNHPRVAQVYALNFSNGHPYLVMELVSGENFSQMLDREGRIDERAVLKMALDVADGLSALNREGMVHGDIKPANIVLDRDGNVKLVDFGLSCVTRRDSSGNFVGTPDYLAPELVRGAADSHSSDLYSFGATLYHLLSGKPPFEGETAKDVLKVRLTTPPIPLGKVSHHISAPTQKLVMRMLATNPVKRQANTDVIAGEIREALGHLDQPPQVVSKDRATANLRHETAVLFTAYFPQEVRPSTPYVLLAFAHVDRAFEDVRRQATRYNELMGNKPSKLSAPSRIQVAESEIITVIPQIHGIEFQPKRQVLIWNPPIQSCNFLFSVSKDVKLPLNGRISFFRGPLLAGEIKIMLQPVCPNSRTEPRPVESIARNLSPVFASYSHRDSCVMEYFRRRCHLFGQNMLVDIYDIRSGQRWEKRLLEMIDQSAVFQLFWSRHSAISENCRKEWEHALKRSAQFEREFESRAGARPERTQPPALEQPPYIRPVWWGNRMPPQPAELQHLHFEHVSIPLSGLAGILIRAAKWCTDSFCIKPR